MYDSNDKTFNILITQSIEDTLDNPEKTGYTLAKKIITNGFLVTVVHCLHILVPPQKTKTQPVPENSEHKYHNWSQNVVKNVTFSLIR